MLAGVTVTISGCGSESPSAPPTLPPTPVSDKTAVIANNHGHVATITAAQQTAGGNVTLNIQGAASHNHVLELTAQEVSTIRYGMQLAKSCLMTNSHMHTITFN
jgi:hypothetical protein